MRSLVTGADGFVGGHLIKHLLDAGDTVTAGVLSDRPLPCETVHLDITDVPECESVLRAMKPDAVYHLAGLAFVPEAESNFLQALAVNVGGVHNILRAVQLLDLPARVVHISSAEVYGKIDPATLPLSERSEVRPGNNYSLSKRMGEMVVERFMLMGRFHPVVMRPFNHIGPGQNERFVTANFAAQLARMSKGLIPPVLRVGNLEARRDFSDVRDVVRAYRLAALRGRGLYNLGSGRAVSIQHILDTLIEIAGLQHKIKIELDPARMRPAEVPEVYTTCAKARAELEWEPHISLRQSLEDVYRDWHSRV